MGERDIEKKVLDLPIPVFDEKKMVHRTLAKLGKDAHAQATSFISANILPDSLAKKRGMVREAVRDIIVEIDEIVEGILS